MEGPREIPGFDRVTGACGEDQVMGGPLMRRGAEDLQLGMLEERTTSHAEQRQVTMASVGFHRTKLKSAPGSQQLLANTDDTMFKRRLRRRWPGVSSGLCLGGPPAARQATPAERPDQCAAVDADQAGSRTPGRDDRVLAGDRRRY